MTTTEIRPVSAYAWSCADCHDTGLALTALDADRDLTDHREDYH